MYGYLLLFIKSMKRVEINSNMLITFNAFHSKPFSIVVIGIPAIRLEIYACDEMILQEPIDETLISGAKNQSSFVLKFNYC